MTKNKTVLSILSALMLLPTVSFAQLDQVEQRKPPTAAQIAADQAAIDSYMIDLQKHAVSLLDARYAPRPQDKIMLPKDIATLIAIPSQTKLLGRKSQAASRLSVYLSQHKKVEKYYNLYVLRDRAWPENRPAKKLTVEQAFHEETEFDFLAIELNHGAMTPAMMTYFGSRLNREDFYALSEWMQDPSPSAQKLTLMQLLADHVISSQQNGY